MVVKEFLLLENVDLSRFATKHKGNMQRAARRSRRRLPGGEVSVPVPPTNDQVSEAMKVCTHMCTAFKSKHSRVFIPLLKYQNTG